MAIMLYYFWWMPRQQKKCTKAAECTCIIGSCSLQTSLNMHLNEYRCIHIKRINTI
uniref:PO61R n=1 Tax=African swine fever virus TaxID=10497 RepID=A0A6G7KTS0_ASF